MKKGQTEMIGLVVIIILLLLSGFLYLLFTLSPKNDLVESARVSLFAGSFLNAVLKYDLCRGANVKEAIKSCDEGLQVCGQESCRLLKNEITAMMAELWKKGYNVEFSFEKQQFLVIGNYTGKGITYAQYINVPNKGVYSANILLEI